MVASVAIRDQFLWRLFLSYVVNGTVIPGTASSPSSSQAHAHRSFSADFVIVSTDLMGQLVRQQVDPLLGVMAAFHIHITNTTISSCIRTKLVELGRINFTHSFSSPSLSTAYVLSRGLYDCRTLQTSIDIAIHSGKSQAELLWTMDMDAVAKAGDLTRVATSSVLSPSSAGLYYLYVPRCISHGLLQISLTHLFIHPQEHAIHVNIVPIE